MIPLGLQHPAGAPPSKGQRVRARSRRRLDDLLALLGRRLLDRDLEHALAISALTSSAPRRSGKAANPTAPTAAPDQIDSPCSVSSRSLILLTTDREHVVGERFG